MKHSGRPWGESPKSTAAWRRRQDRVARDLERRIERQRRVQPYRRTRIIIDLEETQA